MMLYLQLSTILRSARCNSYSVIPCLGMSAKPSESECSRILPISADISCVREDNDVEYSVREQDTLASVESQCSGNACTL